MRQITKLLTYCTLIVVSMSIVATASLQAQVPGVTSNNACQNPRAADSAFCEDMKNTSAEPQDNPIFGPNGIITSIVNVISILVGIAAVIMIIMAGMKFITSGNNPQEVTKAREMVLYALVGVILAALAQAIVRLSLNRIFGLN